jgi:hypothetical protein
VDYRIFYGGLRIAFFYKGTPGLAQNAGAQSARPLAPRSTLIQRACYDRAQAKLIVNVMGAYRQYCGLPVAALDRLMTAPSMVGQYFKGNIEGAGSRGRYDCDTRRVAGY